MYLQLIEHITINTNEPGCINYQLKIDDSWDILLDRGLDVFQKFDSGNAFAIENRMPEMRRIRRFEITYLKSNDSTSA